jgi:hypothetical protein
MHKEAISVSAPEPAMHEAPEVVEIGVKKHYGKFHPHVKLSDGGEHKLGPHPTLMAAHQALGEHLNTYGHEEGKAEPENMQANAEIPQHEGEVA